MTKNLDVVFLAFVLLLFGIYVIGEDTNPETESHEPVRYRHIDDEYGNHYRVHCIDGIDYISWYGATGVALAPRLTKDGKPVNCPNQTKEE